MSECAGGKLGSEEMPTCVFKWDINLYEDVCASNETLFWGQMFSNEISRFMRTSVRLRQPQMRHYQGTYVFKWDINKPLWGSPHLNVNLKWDIMRTCAPCSCLLGHMCAKFSNEILQLLRTQYAPGTKKPHSNEIKQSLLRHLWVCNWYPRGIYQQI